MNTEARITLLQNLYFSENKPAVLRPIDIALLTYLVLRQTEDHFIYDSQLTLADRLGCKRDAIASSVKRLEVLGWLLCERQWQFDEKTHRKTRFAGSTVGLSIDLDKLPQSDDRAKHSLPSSEAITLAAKHTTMLVQMGTKRHKNFDKQQKYAAQRLIEEMGDYEEARALVNFMLSDSRYRKAAQKSLYAVRTRLPAVKAAYDAARTKTTA